MKHVQHKHFWNIIPGIARGLLILGLIGGISFRLVLFLRPFGEHVVNIVWYIGIISYIIFFYIRIAIENHRDEIFSDKKLLKRLKDNKLSKMDAKILSELLGSLSRSNIKYNYMIWFGLSVISLILAVFFI